MKIKNKTVRKLAIVLTMFAVLSGTGCRTAKSASDPGSENLIIYYDTTTGNRELLKAAERYGAKVIYEYKNINGVAVTVPKGKTVREATDYFGRIKGVISVVRDEMIQLD